MAIGGPPAEDLESAFLIISEYNRSVQGFLVREVDRIVNLNWKDILSPPSGTSAGASYLTAVTHVDERMVEVIDVECVLSEVIGVKQYVSDEFREKVVKTPSEKNLVLVADDSVVARKQVCRTLEDDLGPETVIANDGKEAIDLLRRWADGQDDRLERLAMIISDIEMPEMDGYTSTT